MAATTSAQLRIATWNVTDYGGSNARDDDFQLAFYGIFQGRQFAPDVIIGQEFLSQTGVNAFRNLLNSAPGSPGDWAAAPFINGPDSDSAFFYRTGKVEFVAQTITANGTTSGTDQPRHTMRYDFRPVGYAGERATISAYSLHLKSGSSTSEQNRRLLEINRLITNFLSLPNERPVFVAGDLNIQSSNQAAYQAMVNNGGNPGPFYDPIKTPGSWENNGNFRTVFTQDPAGQMDSRFDQILFTSNLFDGEGLEYIGNPNVAYSTTTWDDPNHSYRSWGNDGSVFNVPLKITGNTMVGDAIAQALVTTASVGGHLPVYLDLRVPPKIGISESRFDFGKTPVGQDSSLFVDIYDRADRQLWGELGVQPLTYSITGDAIVSIGPGIRQWWRRGQPIRHEVIIRPTAAGDLSGNVVITSDDPDRLTTTLPYTARAY